MHMNNTKWTLQSVCDLCVCVKIIIIEEVIYFKGSCMAMGWTRAGVERVGSGNYINTVFIYEVLKTLNI